MPLKLDEVVFAENVQPPFEFFLRLFFIFMQDGLGNISADAACRGDKAFVVLQDQFLVDAGIFAINPIRITQGGQFDQVLLARFIFGQQDLVITLILLLLGKSAFVTIRHDIKFAAHNGFHLQRPVLVLMLVGFRHELECAKHIPVVGNSQRRHAILDRLFVEALNGSGSVQ
jgi:hypothetical protein